MSVTDQVMIVLRAEITEERTDELLDFLFDKLPVKFPFSLVVPLAKRIVDQMLPDKILDGIEFVLRKYAR